MDDIALIMLGVMFVPLVALVLAFVITIIEEFNRWK